MLPWQATAEHDPAPRNSDTATGAAARPVPWRAGSFPRQSTAITTAGQQQRNPACTTHGGSRKIGATRKACPAGPVPGYGRNGRKPRNHWAQDFFCNITSQRDRGRSLSEIACARLPERAGALNRIFRGGAFECWSSVARTGALTVPGAVAILAATAAAVVGYIAYGFSSGSWSQPGGGSPPGFAYGVAGGAIILFEMLLWPRKSLWRGWRLGRTKLWMTAHIWLGLLDDSLAAFARRLSFQPRGRPRSPRS